MTRGHAHGLLALLLAAFVGVGLVQASRDSLTVDEGPDLTAAIIAVQEHDLRMNPEHGVLHHALPGVLPVLLADPVVPDTDAYEDGDWFEYTDDLVSANETAGRLDGVVFWWRVVPLLAGALVAAVLYALGARVGGRLGGIVVAGLWCTTPYVVGLAHLGSLDVSFALAVVVLTLTLVRDREAPTTGRAVAVALALGAALAVRHSAVVLVPVAIAFVVGHRWTAPHDLRRGLLAMVFLPVLVVWSLYRMVDPSPVDGPPQARFEALVSTARAHGPIERLTLAVPMPPEWQAGFAYLAVTSDARPAYLFGSTWDGSRPWFFPVSAAVKLPFTATLAVFGGLALALRRRLSVRGAVAAPVVATAGMLVVFHLLQPLNLGLRLWTPVIALGFLAAAPLARIEAIRRRDAILGAIAVGQVLAMVSAHPTSLAWTPPPLSDGYRAVSDSSIDYGQALRTVEDAHAEDPFVAVSTVKPRGRTEPPGTVRVEEAAPEDLVGRVAVGATPLLVTSRDELSWLRAYCPVEVIDHAVLVYAFDEPPDTSPASGTPAAPCDEGVEVSRRR